MQGALGSWSPDPLIAAPFTSAPLLSGRLASPLAPRPSSSAGRCCAATIPLPERWRLQVGQASFVLLPVLAGSLLLLLVAVAFNHPIPEARPDPHPWL
jgi:CBS-domain-containing membrane protein